MLSKDERADIWGVSRKRQEQQHQHDANLDGKKLEELHIPEVPPGVEKKVMDVIDTTLATTNLAKATKVVSGDPLSFVSLPYDLRNFVKGLVTLVTQRFETFDLIKGARSIGHQLINKGLGLEVLNVVEDVLALAVWSRVAWRAERCAEEYADAHGALPPLVAGGRAAEVEHRAGRGRGTEGSGLGRKAESDTEEEVEEEVDEAEVAMQLVQGADAMVRILYFLERLPMDLCLALGAFTALPQEEVAEVVEAVEETVEVLAGGA